METDAYCKRLAWLRPDDLLVLTGDQGAQVISRDILELRDIQRRVDFVLQLQRGDEVYYRHLEFQAQPDTELIDRCFLYNTQMTLQYKLPVVTTIFYTTWKVNEIQAGINTSKT